jgi:hypothetical protein
MITQNIKLTLNVALSNINNRRNKDIKEVFCMEGKYTIIIAKYYDGDEKVNKCYLE